MMAGKDFVFVHIPKCAGKFVAVCLKSNDLASEIQSIHSPAFEIPKKHHGKRVIAPVRNPWAYYVSVYHFQRSYHERKPKKKIASDSVMAVFKAMSLPFDKWLMGIMDLDHLRKHSRTRINWGMGERHHCPLVKWMIQKDIGFYTARHLYQTTGQSDTLDGKCIVDRFLRVERLHDDLIDEFGNIDIPFSKINASEHKSYTEYYDDELAAIVAHKSRLIIDKFEYEFGGES